MGTSVLNPSSEANEDEEDETSANTLSHHSPQKGNIYAYKLDVELKQVSVHQENGAIYDLVTFMEDATEQGEESRLYLAAGINAMVKVY